MKRFMSSTIDELNRVLIPSDLRQAQGWHAKDIVSMYSVDNNTVILKLEKEAPSEPESTFLE